MESESLQELVQNELKTKKHVATEGLVWLTRYAQLFPHTHLTHCSQMLIRLQYRGLDFTAQALRKNLTNPDEELSVSFRDAYGNTLKQFHGMLIKPIFSAAMSATPYRKDFYAKLGDDQTRVNKELGDWLTALEERVNILKEFLGRKENKW